MVTLVEKTVQDLITELTKYNEEYYTLGTPSVDDETYDKKKKQLQSLVDDNPEYADLAKTILTTVGVVTVQTGFKKAKHYQEMLSLDAVYDIAGYQNWLDYCKKKLQSTSGMSAISAQPKLDGLSIELVYRDGVLTQAITRGDGKYGEDVTENIKATGDVPLIVKGWTRYELLSVIGEVVIHKSDFEKYLAKDFANPRNAAVGSLKQLDSSIIPSRHLKVYVFDIKDCKLYGSSFYNYYLDAIDVLQKAGFRVIPFCLSGKPSEAPQIFKNMTIWRNTYDFEMDGVVFKIDEKYTREKLGNKNTVPVWAVAWKFNSMVGTSIIEDVNWSMSKHGNLTPVAKIKEVNIGGVNITNVNLHNVTFARDTLDIKIGDAVTVRRAGDVIPEIVCVDTLKRKNNPNITPMRIPRKCPYCQSSVITSGVNLVCGAGSLCKEQTILLLSHFCSREAMNVEGLSTETLRVLVEQYGVSKARDLYSFDFHRLNGKAGFGPKKIANIELALNNRKNCEKAQLMYAMSIPDVGRRASIAIVNYLTNNNPIKEWYDLSRKDVLNMHIPNIGENIATNLENWNNNYRTEAQQLMDIMNFASTITTVPAVSVTVNIPYANERILFTGALNTMGKTRTEASSLVQALGGITVDTVNQATILIVGDKPGSKLAQASGKGVHIVYEQEFQQVCKDNKLI